MPYFNGIFCVYLSRLCYFVLSPPVGMSYFNGIFLCLSIQIVSSVSGLYSAIDPYVKPFFPLELCSQPWLITSLTPFHRVSRLYEFFVVLFARVSRFNHVFTLWFQFWSRVSCSFNFLMAICSFCQRFLLTFFVFWVEFQCYRGGGGGCWGGGGSGGIVTWSRN